MRIKFLILFIAFMLNTCERREITFQSPAGNKRDTDEQSYQIGDIDCIDIIYVDKAFVGMKMSDLQLAYKNAEFLEEPVFVYGIDGESLGWKVKEKDEDLFFVWTLQNSDEINGITILSESIIIDDNVHVGMTLESFIQKYPEAELRLDVIDYDLEYIQGNNFDYRPEFLSSEGARIANYDFSKPEPEYIDVIKSKAKIQRISIY